MGMEVLAPQSEFQYKYLNSSSDIIISGGAMGCYPKETEYLTPTGWKRFSDYKEGDLVGTVHLDKGDYFNSKLTFEKPKRFIKEACSKMNYIESARFKMTLSPEHTVVYWEDKKTPYRTTTFQDVLERHERSKKKGFYGRFKTSVESVDRVGVDLSDWEIRLQVAVAADGHFPKGTIDNYCQIAVSKDRKVERLKWICSEGGFEIRQLKTSKLERYSNGKIDNFVVHPRIKSKKLSEIFWDANQRQLGIILDEVKYWDGYDTKHLCSKSNTSNFFYTKHKDEADFMQYVGTVCGKTTTIVKDRRVGKESYQVSFTSGDSRSFANKDGKPPIKVMETSDGFKYCFEVSTGFLLVRESDRVFVSGNSSKSYIGLMRHLRWVEDTHYRGFCIRKNSTTLMKPSGLFEEALDMYRQYDNRVVPRLKDQKIVFPSGAAVAFSHYENDNAQELYRGLQLSSAFYDEATDSSERHIWFLISRLRTKAKMKPSIWLTCNPDPDHWLRNWVDWWLYPEGHPKFGLPDPDKNGVERYLLRRGDDLYWGNTKEELILKHGNKDLPINHRNQVKPLSVSVLLGSVYDNPALVYGNPHYVAALEALPEIEKQRNLYGNWEAREEGSSYFDRAWVEEVDHIDEKDIVATVRSFDFAGTLKSDKSPSPDYTASVRMRKLKCGTYVVDDVARHRVRAGDWLKFIQEVSLDDPKNTDYLYPVDPNPAARKMADLMVRQMVEEMGVRVLKIDTNKSKLDRFRPFSSMAQNGGVQWLSKCGRDFENDISEDNTFVFRELEVFTGERKRGEEFHDDQFISRQ